MNVSIQFADDQVKLNRKAAYINILFDEKKMSYLGRFDNTSVISLYKENHVFDVKVKVGDLKRFKNTLHALKQEIRDSGNSIAKLPEEFFSVMGIGYYYQVLVTHQYFNVEDKKLILSAMRDVTYNTELQKKLSKTDLFQEYMFRNWSSLTKIRGDYAKTLQQGNIMINPNFTPNQP